MTRHTVSLVGIVLTVSVCGANSPDPAALEIPPEQLARARELVRQLGSPVYRERDRATRELRGMGRFAVTALAGAATAELDPEVRARCEVLLPAAEAEDMAARVAAFLADIDGKYEHDLPGWAEYRAAAGSDPAARALFSSIIKNTDNHALLRAMRRPNDRLPTAAATRRQQLQIQLNSPGRRLILVQGEIVPAGQPDPADVAALLLAESLIPDRPVNQYRHGTTEYQVTAFLHIAKGKEVVGSDPAFRRLTIHWLETRNGSRGLYDAINVAEQLGLSSEIVNRLAGKAIESPELGVIYKDIALRKLVRNNAKDQLPAVISLFQDESILFKGMPGTPNPDDQYLCDVALLTAIRLTGQNPTDYGFSSAPTPGTRQIVVPVFPQNRIIDYDSPFTQQFRTSGSTTAEMKRKAAFEKWNEWAKQHLNGR